MNSFYTVKSLRIFRRSRCWDVFRFFPISTNLSSIPLPTDPAMRLHLVTAVSVYWPLTLLRLAVKIFSMHLENQYFRQFSLNITHLLYSWTAQHLWPSAVLPLMCTAAPADLCCQLDELLAGEHVLLWQSQEIHSHGWHTRMHSS